MNQLSPLQLSIAAAIVLGAYLVRGIAGFGSGLIAIPLLALMLPLPVVVPMIGLLDYVASMSHGARNRRQIAWRELLPLLPFTLTGVLTALYLFKSLDAVTMKKALGGFVIAYGTYSLLPLPPLSGPRLWAVPAGTLGGLVGTLFGTGGPFYVIYLTLRRLDKARFRATVATIFIIDGGLRLSGYLVSGFYGLQTMVLVAAALPLLVAGMYAGGHIHTTITPRTFARLISLLLIGSGTALLLK